MRNTEYINIKDFKHLIGRRARFKEDNRYVKSLWNSEGVIKQMFMVKKGDLDHVGLSIEFDKLEGFNMKSCYIMPNSFEIKIGNTWISGELEFENEVSQ